MLLKLADLVNIILLKCIVSEECLNACLKIGLLILRDCSGWSCQSSASVTTVDVVWWTVVLLQSLMHVPTCIFEFCCRCLIHYFSIVMLSSNGLLVFAKLFARVCHSAHSPLCTINIFRINFTSRIVSPYQKNAQLLKFSKCTICLEKLYP